MGAWLCAVQATAFLLAACGSPAAQSPPADAAADVAVVTFAQVITLMRARCQPCHTVERLGVFEIGSTAAEDVAAFANLVGPARGSLCLDQGLDRVRPRNPQESLVILKLEARVSGTDPPCGGGMPSSERPPLPAEEIDVIRRWIAAGASGPL